MTTATNYPNGQVLKSSAFTQSAMDKLMQSVTCQMLGIPAPGTDLVRVDWQTQGQPFQNVGSDVCYLACITEDEPYSRVRNRSYTENDGSLIENWQYTRNWRIAWKAYGPNSTDRIRAIHSAMFLDYFNDLLNTSNLFPVSDMPEPVRIPEEINKQWFQRSDFHIDMYENVLETIQFNPVISVEVKISDAVGQRADITVQNS